ELDVVALCRAERLWRESTFGAEDKQFDALSLEVRQDWMIRAFYGPVLSAYLKRLRKRTPFRMLAVAERHLGGGPKHGMVHFHCLFFGLSRDRPLSWSWLAGNWNNVGHHDWPKSMQHFGQAGHEYDFGFMMAKEVHREDDGAVLKSARYLVKYISK